LLIPKATPSNQQGYILVNVDVLAAQVGPRLLNLLLQLLVCLGTVVERQDGQTESTAQVAGETY
jgi:hypothetical protein